MAYLEDLNVTPGEHVAYSYIDPRTCQRRHHRAQYVATVDDDKVGSCHLFTPPDTAGAFWYTYNGETGIVRPIGYNGEERYGHVLADDNEEDKEIVVQAISTRFPSFVRAESLTERLRAEVGRV